MYRKKCDLLEILKSEHFELRLAYLVDIFEIFNQLNLRLQGKDSNLLSHCDSIHAFLAKLELYKKRVDDVLEDAQEEFIELLHDSTAKNVFQSNSLSSFWCSMMESYPKISDLAVRVLLPFCFNLPVR
ncbi:zinc finger BED domain-containing protein 5-like, partial [Portunus trituberculatus]|uniref:zinc finger BED domain-containing protein 5-like n=1 Tax=Portunus trituberculatus TaxID=210409 RepID=UPI001E1D02F3